MCLIDNVRLHEAAFKVPQEEPLVAQAGSDAAQTGLWYFLYLVTLPGCLGLRRVV